MKHNEKMTGVMFYMIEKMFIFLLLVLPWPIVHECFKIVVLSQ